MNKKLEKIFGKIGPGESVPEYHCNRFVGCHCAEDGDETATSGEEEVEDEAPRFDVWKWLTKIIWSIIINLRSCPNFNFVFLL